MKENNPHKLPASGGKHELGESECQMPTQNTRSNLNEMAGKHDHPTGDIERGYTGGETIGPGMGGDNMKIKK